MLLIHGGDDGVGAAHRLVAHGDGLLGLDIRQAVMVNDLQDLHLFQAGDGLGGFVVIHQNHPLSPGPQQVEAGQGAHNLLVFVQHRVAAVAAVQQGLFHVVYVIAEMEADNVLGLAQAHHRHRLIDQASGLPGVQRCGDDAGVPGNLRQLRRNIRLANDQAAHLGLQCGLDHLRLVPADQDALRAQHRPVGIAFGNGDLHLAGHGVGGLGKLIDQIALQHADQIEQRDIADLAFVHGAQVVGGHVAGGQHAVQGAVVVEDGDGGDLPVPHGLPGQLQRHGAVQLRRVVKIQVTDLVAHILNVWRRLKPKAIEHVQRFIIDRADPHRGVLPVPQGIAQVGISHGGHDGIRIRIAVAGNINFVHQRSSDVHWMTPLYCISSTISSQTFPVLGQACDTKSTKSLKDHGAQEQKAAAPAKKVTAQELFRPGFVLIRDKISAIGESRDRTSGKITG